MDRRTIRELTRTTTQKIEKNVFAVGIIVMFLVGASFATVYYQKYLGSRGTIGNSCESYLESFHSGRGIGGVLEGTYSRDQILFCRMQLFAEIDNTATVPEEVLVPNGLGYGDRDDAWSEGGVNYVNLERNLAYVLDKGMIPDMGLWVTNIDLLENRNYIDPDQAPKLPVVNETGYRLFLESLNAWLVENYPSTGYVLWEPCWEFNLWGITNWGGAGGNRYWAIHPSDYYNAMKTIRSVLDSITDRRIYLVSHIIPWDYDSWLKRGKLRIDGTYMPEQVGYLRGIQECDYFTISSYIDRDDWADGVFSTTGGVSGHGTGTFYLHWYYENIFGQIANDTDISANGTRFLGANEYNIGGMENGSPGNTTLFMNYTYTVLVPQYFKYVKMLSWWVPFNTQEEWDTWNNMTQQYDGWQP